MPDTENVEFPNGGVSSRCPAYSLIPTVALAAIADRFAKGVEQKKDRAWNALAPNQQILLDPEFLLNRLEHVIDHVLKLRDKLRTGDLVAIKADDDAGAIAWGGVFIITALDAQIKAGLVGPRPQTPSDPASASGSDADSVPF